MAAWTTGKIYLRNLENLFSPLHQRMALPRIILQCRGMWEEAECEKKFSTRKECINRIDQKFYEVFFSFIDFFLWCLFAKAETFTNLWTF